MFSFLNSFYYKDSQPTHNLFEEQMNMPQVIPTEIVEDILSRLPVRSLLRFRCVCKEWCTLIADPDFVNKHLDRSAKINQNYFTLLQGKSGIYSLEYDACNEVVKLDFQTSLQYSEVGIWGSSNGLVCVGQARRCLVWLWNPACRKQKRIPSGSILQCDYVTRHLGVTCMGFCYNPILEDYEVVKIVECGTCKSGYAEVEVYSLNNNSWTWTETIPYFFRYMLKGELYNGALHWIGTRRIDDSFVVHVIAYDPCSRKIREVVQMPEYHNHKYLSWYNISVFDGCLCFFCKHMDCIQVWVMKEYGVKESWIKLFTVKRNYHLSFAFGVTRKGDFLFEKDPKGLYFYDFKEKGLRPFLGMSIRESIPTPLTTFVESLVQP